MINVLSEKWVKTRKDHRCFSCLRLFERNSTMHRQISTSEDHGIYQLYTCQTCHAIMDNNFNKYYDPDEGWPWGYVREMLDIGETPEDKLSKIIEKL